MASSATIPMAQSVTIPNHVVQISPTSSAPQITDDQGQRLPLARRTPPTRCRARCSRQAVHRRIRQGRDDQRRRPQRRVRHGAQAALRRAVHEARRQGRRQHLLEPRPGELRQRDADSSSAGNPKGWVIIDFPETFQKYVASLVRTGQVGRVADVHDRGTAEHDRRSTRSAARSSGSAAPPRAQQAARPATRSPRSGRRR